MKTPLLPTQVEDVAKIAASVDLPNYSKPGTGKTLTTIGAIEAMGIQRGLVVCPTVATIMWVNHFTDELGAKAQWLRHRTTPVDPYADFHVASYGVLAAQYDNLMALSNDALVIDESQYCKGPTAQRTQCIFGPDCDGKGGIYETSEYCFTLSGDPQERYADDLWSQLRAIQPAALQQYNALSLQQFQQQFCRMELKTLGDGSITKMISVANQNEKLLNSMIYGTIGALRRTIEEVDPFMPPTTERYITVKAEANKDLRAMMRGLTLDEAIELLMNNDSKMATARRFIGLGKVAKVRDYLEEITEPVLVGFWHREVGEQLYLTLLARDHNVELIDGATPPTRRDMIRKRFIEGKTKYLLGQIQAMGVAMDGLQNTASHVVFAELDWSATRMEQFYKRIVRKGQRKHTQVDYCISDTVIDDALTAVATRKAEGVRQIHG